MRAVVLFLLVTCAGCLLRPNHELDGFLAREGFDAAFSRPDVTPWERQTFNLMEKDQWQAKSRAHVPDWEGAYYRFTIVKETYRSEQEAVERLNRLLEKPPGLGPEEELVFPLRNGFRSENTVYVVSCRVSSFVGRMRAFTRALEQEIMAH